VKKKMTTEAELRKQVGKVKLAHNEYKVAQSESNAALARYKREIAILEEI
jgi:hypothetical protein